MNTTFFNLTLFLNLLPFFMLGIGIGIASFYAFYDKNSMTELDRKKHDLEVKKLWFAMLAEQKKETSKQKRWNNNDRRN